MALKRNIPIPVSLEEKEFCEYMGYFLRGERDNLFYFDVPSNHICMFKVNFDRWKIGQFDKDVFLKRLEEVNEIL